MSNFQLKEQTSIFGVCHIFAEKKRQIFDAAIKTRLVYRIIEIKHKQSSLVVLCPMAFINQMKISTLENDVIGEDFVSL